MTIDVHESVRRAIDDIIDATGDIRPCPTLDDDPIKVRRHAATATREPWARRGDRTDASGARRGVAIAAGLLVVIGVTSVMLVGQRRDSATPSLTVVVDVGAVDRFPVGSVITIEDPPLFVVNDASTGIVVFDARSTHLECILVPNNADTDASVGVPDPGVGFIDPCHGSLFDRAGNKLAGPAPRSMDSYRFEVTDQRVLVDVSQPIRGDPATTPVYSGDDLDMSLSVVGRGWGDSMEFSLDRDTNARLYNVWQTAIADCMHAEGFPDYQATIYPDNGGFEDLVNPLDRRYATVMGYHQLPAEPVDPNTHTDDSRAVASGCANSTFGDTYGRFDDYWDVNDRLRSGIAAAIVGFPESDTGQVATAEWAACMAEHGHQFGSPRDAILTYADRPTVSATEIAIRLDDLDCDITASYTQRQHDWERIQIQAWRADNADTVAIALNQKQLIKEQLANPESAAP